MAWKIERWLAEVFPGDENIYSAYRELTRRELAIVAAGVLDNALAELLSLRFQDYPNECEAFLGANEDGRAPCGSFGARIQLALLLGIITEPDASILRTIKSIRNKFAHRINVDFTDDQVKPLVLSLHDKWRDHTRRLTEKRLIQANLEKINGLRPYFDMTPEAGAGLLLSVFSVFQAYFHRLHGLVDRVGIVRSA